VAALRLAGAIWFGAALAACPVACGTAQAENVAMDAELDARMALAPSLLTARSKEDAALKSGIMQRLYKIGSDGRWAVDLDAGTISFSNEGLIVTAPVQVIGTYNTRDGTWLWGWDHPSVTPQTAEAAKLLHAYGIRHGLERITTRKISCSEEEAWELTSMASYLSGAQGLYRGPSGPTLVFMTFGTVTLSKSD
jgi:hypothetical protein